ncbi:hypothetical protein [Kineococcus sp. SYSU DK001]|uniref:hypothetical protein n=1 Tax=Kineococcus sp. SYSU DK001 TaxID=3383122 RepID=UPI003D7D05D5
MTAGTLDAPLAPLRQLVSAYAHPAGTEPTRVSVVGNAPLTDSPGRAAAIDSSDLVVRVNGFLLDEPGGPPRAGRRCDVVLFTRGTDVAPHVFEDYSRRLYVLHEPEQTHVTLAFPTRWPRDLGQVHLPNEHFTLPLADLLGLPMRTALRWATSGTAAVHMAVTLFPRAALVLAGFSFVARPDQRSWEHATGRPADVTDNHELPAEARYLSDLVRSGRARLLD